MIRCPMCGAEYDGSKTVSCNGCPMAKACAMACCPRCGYKMPAESRLGKFIKRLTANGGVNEHPNASSQR